MAVVQIGINNPVQHRPEEPRVKQLNAALAKLHDGKTMFFKDIGDRFLEEDGGLSQEVMSDYLHLAPKGYQIWADAIKDDVQKRLP